jgi:hypothetical protein
MAAFCTRKLVPCSIAQRFPFHLVHSLKRVFHNVLLCVRTKGSLTIHSLRLQDVLNGRALAWRWKQCVTRKRWSVPSLTKRSWALCPRRQRPYGQTAELYFAAMKMEGRRLKGGWSSKCESPRQSPYNNCGDECRWTANFYEALRCYEAWLVSKESPVYEAPSIVILNPLVCCIPPSCRRLLTIQHTKTSSYKTLCSQ